MAKKEAPYHKIKRIIEEGDYISPNQIWHDYDWPKIYTRSIIMQLSKDTLEELRNNKTEEDETFD